SASAQAATVPSASKSGRGSSLNSSLIEATHRLGGPGSLMSRTCIFPLWHRPAVLARAVGNSDALSTALSACAAGRREGSPAGHVFCNRKFSGVEESTRRRRARAMAVLVTGGAGYI